MTDWNAAPAQTAGDEADLSSVRLGTLDPWWRESPHYGWALDRGLELRTIEEVDGAAASEVDVVVTLDNYYLPAVERAWELVRRQTPVLVLADGILEYRNTWEHPQIAPGAMFQPAVGQKVACIGRAQARMLESWGNLGKCEVVGLPKLDRLLGRTIRPSAPDRPLRLMIATARTPSFTPAQHAFLVAALVDLRAALRSANSPAPPAENRRAIDVVWRLTGELAGRIGLTEAEQKSGGGDLGDVLATCDAVVTTPSTVMMEAMLIGLPVALLDYQNCPHFVPAAWTITARDHLPGVLEELRSPPLAKLLYQRAVLHDNLECRSPAAPRLVRLIAEMARSGRESRAAGKPLSLPRRILTDPLDGHHLPDEAFDLQRLFPDHPVFGSTDRAALQVEVEQWRREATSLRAAAEEARREADELRNALERFERHPVLGPLLRLRRRWIAGRSNGHRP